ncbi:hypothetical protein TASIC1_0001034100 [Trichoderma asperellum]|uniref:Uncharacterized protein n=1 Tax=Trichoderma asperellum TaxID=101201 RepID=A0A6V8QIU6_TRIAP|nr:hypothetical protein TASIC1_0001034100 [Trichoderma asperellum]
MPQEVDTLSKVGRGGAGNYDLEAQELRAIASSPSTAPSPGSARAGRGGAGNFADPTQAAQSQGQLADETGAAVASRLKRHPQPHRAGWSGRGGAGNFNADQAAENERRQEEEERSKVAELDKKIKEAVEGALRPPERAHQHQRKEEEEEEP